MNYWVVTMRRFVLAGEVRSTLTRAVIAADHQEAMLELHNALGISFGGLGQDWSVEVERITPRRWAYIASCYNQVEQW